MGLNQFEKLFLLMKRLVKSVLGAPGPAVAGHIGDWERKRLRNG